MDGEPEGISDRRSSAAPAPVHTVVPASSTHSTPQTRAGGGVHPRAEHAMVIDPRDRDRDSGPRKALLLWWQQQSGGWFGHVVFVDGGGAVRQEMVPAELVRQLPSE